jgi:hypothetical protein
MDWEPVVTRLNVEVGLTHGIQQSRELFAGDAFRDDVVNFGVRQRLD